MGSPQTDARQWIVFEFLEVAFAPDLGPQDDVRTFTIQAPDDGRSLAAGQRATEFQCARRVLGRERTL